MRWFLPLQWAQAIVEEVVVECEVSAPLASAFYNELNQYRNCFRQLYCYDWVCIPLAYTQVAALATYAHFAFCLVGRQFLDPDKRIEGNEVDLYIPVFTIVQFLFFIGWLKVRPY